MAKTPYILLVFIYCMIMQSCRLPDKYTSDYFDQPKLMDIPDNIRASLSRKITDVTNDGVADMVEIGQNFGIPIPNRIRVFQGYVNEDGLLGFQDKPVVYKLPPFLLLMMYTEFDICDLNQDGLFDIVASAYNEYTGPDDIPLSFLIQREDHTFRHEWESLTLNRGFWELWDDIRQSDDQIDLTQVKMNMMDFDMDGDVDCVVALTPPSVYPDLHLYVYHSTYTTGELSFNNPRHYIIKNFMPISELKCLLHLGHLNGDNQLDLLAISSITNQLIIRPAFIEKSITVSVHQSVTTHDLRYVGLESFGLADINRDGYDDIWHIGIYNGKKVLSYNVNTMQGME